MEAGGLLWGAVEAEGTQRHEMASDEIATHCQPIALAPQGSRQVGGMTLKMEFQVVHGRARALARREGAAVAAAAVSSLPRRQRVLARSGSEPCLLLFPRGDPAGGRSAQGTSASRRGHAQRTTSMGSEHQRSEDRHAGRVAIPPKLREVAVSTAKSSLIGVVDRAEVWNARAWAAVERATDEGINEGMWL